MVRVSWLLTTVFAALTFALLPDFTLADPNLYLARAVNHDDVAAAKAALDQGADVNYRIGGGNLLIWDALVLGKFKCIDLLLENGADAKYIGTSGDSLLVVASHAKDPELLRKLIARGADVNHIGPENSTSALARAIMERDHRCILVILEAGADVNRVVFDRSPLGYAAQEGDIEVMKWLLDRGALLESTARVKYTPLDSACWRGHLAAVNLLVEKGADIKALGDDGLNLLELAALYGHEEVARRFHELGLRTENRLHFAAGLGNLAVVQKEISGGANLNLALKKSNYTPLIFASAGGQPKVVKFLTDHGADPNARTYEGLTALHMMPTPEIAQLLLDAKADVNAKDPSGLTPLDYALDEPLRQLLIRNGGKSEFE